MKIVQPFLISCVIISSLLNTGFFGNVSLTGYFGFCITSIVASLAFLSYLWIKSKDIKLALPSWNDTLLYTFLALGVYILVHGLANSNFNLSHFYWLAAATLLLSVRSIAGTNYSRNHVTKNNAAIYKNFATYLHCGIVFIAVIESLIVIFQWFGLFPSMSTLFACTGTWVNPNVTAMFLALSLLSQKQLSNYSYRSTSFVIPLSAVLLAIVFLQSRTAYIVTIVCLIEIFKTVMRVNKLPLIKISIVAAAIVALAFLFKTNSTDGRIQIWKNCLQLIATKPITGAGFGQFEKEYNTFVAQHNLPSNDHVYMPYNDFLELAIEGGIIAVVLWIAFLVLFIWRFKDNSYGLTLIINFIIIQLTNFGFQAIPVFALFLIYLGCLLPGDKKFVYPKKVPALKFGLKPVLAIAIIAELFFCAKIFPIANAFHQSALIHEEYLPQQGIEEYEGLSTTLDFSSNYHESYGDLFMQTGNYSAARLQYRQALRTTSRPDVLGKCGWCYGQTGQYDSAFYYFEMIEKIQPYKYSPRVALLKLYEQKKDTVSLKLKAREIVAMPVKVPSAEVDRIKAEAGKWLQDKL